MTEGTSTSGAPAATEAAGPVAAIAATAAAPAPAPVDAQVAAMAAVAMTATPVAAEKAEAPAVGPAAAALAAIEAAAAVEAVAAKKAAAEAKKGEDSEEASMSEAEVAPEVELATLGEAGTAVAGQAGLPCGVLPVVDAPVAVAPVDVPVGDAGFSLSPALLGLLGLGALGLGYLLLRDDDDDDDDDIEDENDDPVATDETITATEDGADVTGTLEATDPDGDEADLVYELDTAVAGLTLNEDGTYTFDTGNAAYDGIAQGATQTVTTTYTVTDEDGGSDTGTITITVTGANDAPVITAPATANIAENQPAGTVVFDANATDATGDDVTFSLTGPDAALFTIDPVTGVVTADQAFDFEAADRQFNVTVVATDESGATDTQDVVINVTDVNENTGPVLEVDTEVAVDENMDTDDVVVDADAEDADGDDLTFTISGEDADQFEIDEETGEVRFIDSPDFETQEEYNFTITVTDEDGLSDSEDVTVNVNDIDEPEGPTVVLLDEVDNDNNPNTENLESAAGGDFIFVEDDDVGSLTRITGFDEGDTLIFEEGTEVSFGTSADDPNDLQIIVNNNGVVSEVILDDVLPDNAGLIFDEDTAEEEVGFDFFSQGDAPDGTVAAAQVSISEDIFA